MYSNIYYDYYTGIIHLWEKNPKDIKPKYSQHAYKPYLYDRMTREQLDKNIEPDAFDIYGKPLIKHSFHTEKECRNYATDHFMDTAGYNGPVVSFLLDRYHHMCHEPRMADFKLNCLFWDIETFSEDGVPRHKEYKDTPIFSVVFIHNITNEYVVIAVDASVKGKSGIKKIRRITALIFYVPLKAFS